MSTSNTAAHSGSSPSPLLGGWQPIATAPRDGSELLLYWFEPGGKTYFPQMPGAKPEEPSHNVKIGYWKKRTRYKREELGGGLVRESEEVYAEEWVDKATYNFTNFTLNPTHWMALPAPPPNDKAHGAAGGGNQPQTH